ncbi:MAG: response regulator [Myxococcales bacterium]|nr:response regulator [Myxococcales bacterium]
MMHAVDEVAPQPAPVVRASGFWPPARLWATAALGLAATLALDLSLPLGVAGGVPYAAVTLLGLRGQTPRTSLLLAACGTGLTLVGWAASPPGGVAWMVTTNRALAVFAIWVTGIACAKRVESLRALSAAHEDLERQVQARTAELQETHGALLAERDEHARAEAALLHARRLEALGRLAGGVAHDFNNVLAGVLGHAELLSRQLPAGSQAQRDAQVIVELAHQGADRTRQLLVFGRQGKARLTTFDLKDAVARTARTLERTLGECVALQLELPEAAGWIRGDEVELSQLLLNLCLNARDAMPEGGTLSIALRPRELKQSFEEGSQRFEKGAYLELEVRDTGAGMAPEVLERAMDPYFTTKPPGVGSGLGLAQVQGAARNAHGRITVTSQPGEGTSFRVCFPLAEPPCEQAAEATPQRRQSAVASRQRILVAEDEPIVRRFVARLLQHEGFEVSACASGEEAERLFTQSEGHFDLLLTDVLMGGIDGFELARRLLERSPSLPVLLMSGHTGDTLRRRNVDAGRFRVLDKPVESRVLVEAVRSALETSAVGSEAAILTGPSL